MDALRRAYRAVMLLAPAQLRISRTARATHC